MPIKVKQPPLELKAEESPHGEAAAQMGTDMVEQKITMTEPGQPDKEIHDYTQVPVPITSPTMDEIGVRLAYRMPVAPFTMLEFDVSRKTNCNPEDADATFIKVRQYVEDWLNMMIEEQDVPEDVTEDIPEHPDPNE